MNNTIIPAKTMCNHCQNIGLIDAEHCVACGKSFVFGKPDAWKSKSYSKDWLKEKMKENPLEKFRDQYLNYPIGEIKLNTPCLWDSIPKNSGPMMLSCSCPK